MESLRRSVGMSEFANNHPDHGNVARRLPRRIWAHELLRKFLSLHRQVSSEEQVGVRRKHPEATRGWGGGHYDAHGTTIADQQFFE